MHTEGKKICDLGATRSAGALDMESPASDDTAEKVD